MHRVMFHDGAPMFTGPYGVAIAADADPGPELVDGKIVAVHYMATWEERGFGSV